MIVWHEQHCGVHQAPFDKVLELMPDLQDILKTFPDDPKIFTWDVKVHMLMPRQYPCIPNWHVDNVPRENGIQKFDKIKPEYPMYCWVSGAPLTQFKHGYVLPQKWHRFTQQDEHRGTAAAEFGWRCFIRATHFEIMRPKPNTFPGCYLRRHSQVYVDANTYQW